MDDVEAAEQSGTGGQRGAEEPALGELPAPAPSPSPTLARERRELVERLDERADRHPVAVYLARLSEGSRQTMRRALAQVVRLVAEDAATVRSFPWASLRYPHLQALRAELAARHAPATVNLRLSAVRGVLQSNSPGNTVSGL